MFQSTNQICGKTLGESFQQCDKIWKNGECQWEINTSCDEFQKNMDNIFMERVGVYQT